MLGKKRGSRKRDDMAGQTGAGRFSFVGRWRGLPIGRLMARLAAFLGEKSERESAMPYPVILGGDHAEFEQEWTASGRPDHERPDWPLPSFDADDWANAFCDVVIEKGFRPDHPEDVDWVRGWFANALMRGYDEAMSRRPAILRTRLRIGFKSRRQVSLFMIWREYLCGQEVEHATVLFNSQHWISV